MADEIPGEAQTPTERELANAWEYVEEYYRDPNAKEVLGLLARHRPEVFTGYVALRRGVFNTDENAALSPKMKELVIIAIEVAVRKSSPPPLGHTRRAIAAGATVAEIAEVVSLCLMIGGMLTYHESGYAVLKAAEEYAARTREDLLDKTKSVYS